MGMLDKVQPDHKADHSDDVSLSELEASDSTHSNTNNKTGDNPYTPVESMDTGGTAKKARPAKKVTSGTKMKIPNVKIGLPNFSKKMAMNSLSIAILLGCAGYGYYQYGDQVSKDLPYTKYAMRQAEYQAQRMAQLAEAKPTQQQPVINNVAQSAGTSTTAANAIQQPTLSQATNSTTPSKMVPIASMGNQGVSYALNLKPESDNYFVEKMSAISSDITLLKSNIATQERVISELRDLNSRLMKEAYDQKTKIDSLNIALATAKEKISSNEMISSDAIELAQNANRIAQDLRSNSDSMNRSVIKNEVNVDNLKVETISLSKSIDEKYLELKESLADLSKVVKSKSHIETLPSKVQYFDGQAITHVAQDVSIQQLQNYGAKVTEKIVPDFHLLYAANGRFRIKQPDGRQAYLKIGDNISQYGQVMDFMPSNNVEDSYLILSSGYKLTTEDSKGL